MVSVVADVFRSKDLSGWAKALWVIFIIILPWLGVLVYLIARGDGMNERNLQMIKDADKAQREYIREVAHVSPAEELKKLADLQKEGVISEEEFAAQKAKILAQ